MRRGRIVSTPIPATAGQILEANENRVGIVISTHNATSFWIGNGSDLAANAGLLFAANFGFELLCVCDYGDLITRAIWGLSSGAAITVGIAELIEDDPVIRKKLYSPNPYGKG